VVVETELSVTGRPSQFWLGIMQDVASSMLTDFSRRLSALMAASDAPAPAAAAEPEQTLAVGGLLGKVLFGRIRAFFRGLVGRS